MDPVSTHVLIRRERSDRSIGMVLFCRTWQDAVGQALHRGDDLAKPRVFHAWGDDGLIWCVECRPRPYARPNLRVIEGGAA